MYRLSILIAMLVAFSSHAQNQYEKEFAAIDSTGAILFKFYAKQAYDYQGGIARIKKYVRQGDKAYYRYGGMDEKGVIVIPPVWDKLRDFKTDVTFARKPDEKEYYLIGKNGLPVNQEKYTSPGYFFEGVAKFKKGDKYGFVDSTGANVIQPKYVSVSFCSHGLICVNEDEVNENYHFIKKNGEKAFNKTYRQAGTTSFSDGLARVKIDGKTGLIDTKGNVVVKPKFSTVSGFGDSLLTVAQGKSYNDFGYFDFSGNLVIPGPYYSAGSFKDGYAAVKNNEMKAGIIDRKGNALIPFEYDAVYNKLKKDGYFSAYIGKEWFYFNEKGEPFTDFKVKNIQSRDQGKWSPYQDAKTKLWGYLNSDGTIAIKAQYVKCRSFGANNIGIVQLSE